MGAAKKTESVDYGGERPSVLMSANESICRDLLDAELSLLLGLVYISPKRRAVHGANSIDAIAARRTLRLSAFAIRALLAAAETKEKAAAFFVPVDDYRWSDTTRSAASGVWS